MTSKDKIIEVYPKAYAEKYTERNPLNKELYYLIWTSRKTEEKARLGEGTTEAKAWKDALYWIENSSDKN